MDASEESHGLNPQSCTVRPSVADRGGPLDGGC